MEPKISDNLREARDRIADPKNWIQGNFARSSNGHAAPVGMGIADKWCSVGAILETRNKVEVNDWDKLPEVKALTAEITRPPDVPSGGVWDVTAWNDYAYRTHDEVMQAFDLAIKRADERGE